MGAGSPGTGPVAKLGATVTKPCAGPALRNVRIVLDFGIPLKSKAFVRSNFRFCAQNVKGSEFA